MSSTVTAMNEAEVQERLTRLPHWQLHDNAIERQYDGKTSMRTLDKLNAVAQLSEALNHHPELVLCGKTLTVRYCTHDANGLTYLDFELAHQVEALLSRS